MRINKLKPVVILLAIWIGCLPSALADLRTFRIAGTVSHEHLTGKFVVGRPYTLTLTIDTLSPKNVVVPERGDFPTAITSFVFDYDSGVYIAQAQNKGGIDVGYDSFGRDYFHIFGLTEFPPVAGETHTGTYFSLMDTSGVAFASTDLPKTLDAEAFHLRDFEISWGIDFDTRHIGLTVDSISLIQRRPEIAAWSRATNDLILNIEFPTKLYTNILERSFQLEPTEQWETVTQFISSGGNTNWVVPLQTNNPAVFYRMKP